MDRRALLKLGLIGTAAVALPKAASAGKMGMSPMAGGLYYTKENPGRWAKKVGGHLPAVEVMGGGKVKVVTGHAMKAHAHYIVKHMVLDKDFNFITENMFDLTKDKAAVSSFDLGGYKGKIHVLSVCNKHDTWMNTATV